MSGYEGHAKSVGGWLKWSNNRQIMDYLASVEGKELFVTIDRVTGNRSYSQNSYLWGVVYKTVSEHTGNTEQELHETFKRLYLPPTFIKYRDREIKVPGSTASLDKAKFGEYIERIRAEVATMGVTIPDADREPEAKVEDFHKDLEVPEGEISF